MDIIDDEKPWLIMKRFDFFVEFNFLQVYSQCIGLKMTDNNTTLKDAGLKVTHPRTKILEILQSNPEFHLSADAIHNYLIKNI